MDIYSTEYYNSIKIRRDEKSVTELQIRTVYDLRTRPSKSQRNVSNLIIPSA